jgi:hypothetical protein
LRVRWFAAAKARLAARIRRREGRARALTFAESLAAGAIAGVVNNLCTIPFDVVEAERRAASRRKRENKKGAAPEPPSAALSRLTASLADRADIARRIAARRGVTSLWRGAGASCVLVLGPAANFAAFDRLKRAFLSLAFSSDGGSRAAAAPRATRSYLGFVEAFVLGVAAKAFAIALATPVTRAAVIARAAERSRAARNFPVGGEGRSGTNDARATRREETRRRRPVDATRGGDDDDADEGIGASGGLGEDGEGAPRGEGEDRSEEDASDASDFPSASFSFSFAARVRLWSEAVWRATREGGVGSLWAGAGGARFARSAFAAAVMFAVRERLDAAVGGGDGDERGGAGERCVKKY